MRDMYKTKELTLRAILLNSAKTHKNRRAFSVINSNSYLTYKEVALLAALLSANLKKAGATTDSKIAILSENRPEWSIAYFSIVSSGMAVVPILPDFHTNQINAILEHSEAEFLILSSKLESKISEELQNKIKVIPIEILASQTALSEAKNNYLLDDLETYFPPVDENSVASIIYTSGSTGNPKGVMLTHKNITSNFVSTKSIIYLSPRDRILSLLPLAHTYECTIGLICGFAQGCSIWYLNRPASASVLLPALKKVRPTIVLSVPLIIEKIYRGSILPALEKIKLWQNPKMRPLLQFLAGKKLMKTFGSKIRFFGIGGSSLAPDVEKFLLAVKFPYAVGYGLTETAPLIAGAGPFKTKFRSTGKTLSGVQLRIENGEIQAIGPNIMKGYFKNQELTKEVFTADGWFRTGDLGEFDEKGFLFIKGRAKAMLLGPTGENIYPEEIEAMLNAQSEVEESLVFQQGHTLSARVLLKEDVLKKLKAGASDSQHFDTLIEEKLEQLRKELNKNLAKFNQIQKMILQEIPFEKTPTMKIKRFLYV